MRIVVLPVLGLIFVLLAFPAGASPSDAASEDCAKAEILFLVLGGGGGTGGGGGARSNTDEIYDVFETHLVCFTMHLKKNASGPKDPAATNLQVSVAVGLTKVRLRFVNDTGVIKGPTYGLDAGSGPTAFPWADHPGATKYILETVERGRATVTHGQD